MPDIKDKALPESHKTGRDSPWGTSFVLALFMHGFLFAGLFYVVQWTSLSDEVVYAELWAPETAPLAKTPVPEPPKVSEPTPQEEAPQEEPAKEVAQQSPEPLPDPDAIALQEAEKQKAEQLAKEKAAKEKAEKIARAKALAKQLQKEDLKQMDANRASASGVATPKGVASAAYASRIIQCVRAHLNFPVTADMKPKQYIAVYEVSILADGTQTSAPKLKRASGLQAFDIAAERAIRSCKFPPTETHKPETLEIQFDPVEMRTH